jgi:hypothetical protein
LRFQIRDEENQDEEENERSPHSHKELFALIGYKCLRRNSAQRFNFKLSVRLHHNLQSVSPNGMMRATARRHIVYANNAAASVRDKKYFRRTQRCHTDNLNPRPAKRLS